MVMRINPTTLGSTISEQQRIHTANFQSQKLNLSTQANSHEGIALSDSLKKSIDEWDAAVKRVTEQRTYINDPDLVNYQWDKNNILSQASQSIMAQANQSPQAVLRLLN